MAPLPLDTSGEVYVDSGPHAGQRFMWRNLSPFEQGYGSAVAHDLYERLLAAFTSEGRANASMDARVKVAFARWCPETLAAIRKDCAEAVLIKNGWTPLYHKTVAGGRAFWAGRNKYPGRWRTGSGKVFHPVAPYLNDEGRVCLKVGA